MISEVSDIFLAFLDEFLNFQVPICHDFSKPSVLPQHGSAYSQRKGFIQ